MPRGHGEIMLKSLRNIAGLTFVLSLCFGAIPARAQMGNSGSIEGVVKDASGGAIAGAKEKISNPVSGFTREITTGGDGKFRVTNGSFYTYHIVVTATGVSPYTQDPEVRSTV